MATVLRERFGLEPVADGDLLRVRTRNGAKLVPALCAGLDVPVYEVTVTRPSLDDVFLHHTGRGLDTGTVGADPVSVGARS
ncbi:hypothetical protein AB5L52_43230 [Streptomyces sp. CG4]|uniref:hypothetical protein n=1 Tax=Streptomyces sp. CG4 TaxID=408783 RepID=UPI0034E24FBA